MGEPDWGAGNQTAPTSFPVILSNARSIAPRGWPDVVENSGSPAIKRLFVTNTPALPGWPVGGMLRPRRAGLFLIASGVSPLGACQRKSPVSRAIAVSVPYGGLTRGRPSTSARTGGLAAV